MKKQYNIGMEATLDIIGGKWKPLILCHLGHGELRNGELRRKIPSISQKVLTQQLRELEEDGIIQRKSYNEMPPKVVYSVTEEGKTLKEILVAMSDWGERRVDLAQQNGELIEILNEDYEGFLKM